MKLCKSLLYLLLLSSCIYEDQSVPEYHKYVYEYPAKNLPVSAVTEIDIWVSRILFRGLVKLNQEGMIGPDIAADINKISDKKYQVLLKKNQRFSSGKLIDAKSIQDCFNSTKKKSKSQLVQQIQTIKVINNYELIIDLAKSNHNFIKDLSTHILSVYNHQDLTDSSNLYRRDGHNLILRKEVKRYPKKIKLIKAIKDLPEKFDPEIPFDTYLAYTAISKNESNKNQYRVQDVWGLVLNLKDKFSNIQDRYCLSEGIDRNKLVELALTDHVPTNSIYSNKQIAKKCNTNWNKSFSILLPIEIKDKSEKICSYLSSLYKVSCEYTQFVQLLERVKKSEFDTVLLSLTSDYPYIEANLSLLDPTSNFSIVNIPINIPSELKTSYGKRFASIFENFINEKMLFISISNPYRTVFASDKEKYHPSLISPSFDPLENLIR